MRGRWAWGSIWGGRGGSDERGGCWGYVVVLFLAIFFTFACAGPLFFRLILHPDWSPVSVFILDVRMLHTVWVKSSVHSVGFLWTVVILGV